MLADTKISIFIICLNEERIIEECLKQASKLADEIIIVDSGSSDKTLEITKKYTDKINHQDWLGYGAQKNHALSLCNNEWVISLDADEVLTDELIEEIRSLDFHADGYKIARRLFIGDKFIRWGGYYPDYQLRLFKKSLGKFSDRPVHESVKLQGHAEELMNPLNHYAYIDIEAFKTAYNKYAKLSLHKPNLIKAVLNFIFTFINKFIFRLGFLHGSLGLKLAWLHSVYSFEKYTINQKKIVEV